MMFTISLALVLAPVALNGLDSHIESGSSALLVAIWASLFEKAAQTYFPVRDVVSPWEPVALTRDR